MKRKKRKKVLPVENAAECIFIPFFFFFLSPFQISQDRYIFHAAKAHYIHAGSV